MNDARTRRWGAVDRPEPSSEAGAEPPARRPLRAGSAPRAKDLAGLVVVVAARGRRGALARCLEGLRSSAEYGADIVYVGSPSPDRSIQMVRDRFPFVRIEETAEAALAATDLAAAPPRFVAAVTADVVIDRFALRLLLRAAAAAPRGGSVAPVLVDPAGGELDLPRPRQGAVPTEARFVRVARRRDVDGGDRGPLRVVREARALVPRPDELRAACARGSAVAPRR
ncbi:MAG: hypothetical protein AAGA20_20865 [Planctomycetota bacterium]